MTTPTPARRRPWRSDFSPRPACNPGQQVRKRKRQDTEAESEEAEPEGAASEGGPAEAPSPSSPSPGSAPEAAQDAQDSDADSDEAPSTALALARLLQSGQDLLQAPNKNDKEAEAEALFGEIDDMIEKGKGDLEPSLLEEASRILMELASLWCDEQP